MRIPPFPRGRQTLCLTLVPSFELAGPRVIQLELSGILPELANHPLASERCLSSRELKPLGVTALHAIQFKLAPHKGPGVFIIRLPVPRSTCSYRHQTLLLLWTVVAVNKIQKEKAPWLSRSPFVLSIGGESDRHCQISFGHRREVARRG